MGNKGHRLREKICGILELPKDIVLDVSKVTIIGTGQITVENHKSLVEYGGELIRISTGSGTMKLHGKKMVIKNVAREEIIITGEIANIEFY